MAKTATVELTTSLMISKCTDVSLLSHTGSISAVHLCNHPSRKIITFLQSLPALQTVNTTPSVTLPKKLESWMVQRNISMTSARIHEKKQYVQLPKRYLAIRDILCSASGTSARFLLKYLADNGSKSAQAAFQYLGLEHAGDASFDQKTLCLAEVALSNSLASASNAIIHIWGALLYVLPIQANQALTPDLKSWYVVTTVYKNLQKLHERLIYQRQLRDRILAWNEQMKLNLKYDKNRLSWQDKKETRVRTVRSITKIELEKPRTKIEGMFQDLLKYQLKIKRYGDRLTEREKHWLYEYEYLGKSCEEIAAQMNKTCESNIGATTIRAAINKANRKVQYYLSRDRKVKK